MFRSLRRFWAPFVVIVGVVWGLYLRHPALPDHEPTTTVRIATWNLRNFPDGHDVDRLVRQIRRIDPDVLALQEVIDVVPLREALPEYAFHLSSSGGRANQRLGVALHRERVELRGAAQTDERIAADGRLRPAYVAGVRTVAGVGLTFVVVHLKSSPRGADTRARQWALLRELLPADEKLVVLGDFNPTGGPNEDAADERSRLQAELGRAGLTMVPVVGQCTAYWEGGRFDAWQEPSWLDMIWVREVWVRGPLPDPPVGHVGSVCAALRCQPVRSTSAYPNADLEWMSDHCPVWVDLPIRSRGL